MIELTILEFHQQQYEEDRFCLYVVKNAEESILYVGISTKDVWERWFGWGGHITWDGNVIYGESPVGVKIENHLPDSLKWKIQLWSLKDCVEFCREELSTDIAETTVHHVEPIMIRKLSPAMNTTLNLRPGKDTTPKSPKEIEREGRLDQVYKEIFDKKNLEKKDSLDGKEN
jgi:hypothetical protein